MKKVLAIALLCFFSSSHALTAPKIDGVRIKNVSTCFDYDPFSTNILTPRVRVTYITSIPFDKVYADAIFIRDGKKKLASGTQEDTGIPVGLESTIEVLSTSGYTDGFPSANITATVSITLYSAARHSMKTYPFGGITPVKKVMCTHD
jgi:hypothetical protein